ncbi:MAG: hypothetical protein L3J19_06850 [Sulfurimonas sp.]|nr:hypothetical protein [Sulfurimonas sp.]
MDKIKLAHGNGGQGNNEPISKIFYKAFKNEILEASEDTVIMGTKPRYLTCSVIIKEGFSIDIPTGELLPRIY